jgi:uncharacterized protein related to proFAR isomerase
MFYGITVIDDTTHNEVIISDHGRKGALWRTLDDTRVTEEAVIFTRAQYASEYIEDHNLTREGALVVELDLSDDKIKIAKPKKYYWEYAKGLHLAFDKDGDPVISTNGTKEALTKEALESVLYGTALTPSMFTKEPIND